MNDETFRKIIQGAENHLARVKEGRNLLKNGRSLSEMLTEQIGLTIEEMTQRRKEYLEELERMDNEFLSFVYKNTMYQLHRRYEDEDGGTSELEWRVNAFKDEFRCRKMDVPEFVLKDFEK